MAIWWCSRPDGQWANTGVVTEFEHGRHSACGPAAHENGMAALFGVQPAFSNVEVICERDTVHGWYVEGTGQTSHNIALDLIQYDSYRVTVTEQPYTATGYGADQVRAALAGLAGGVGFLIAELAHAANLPNNEPGVDFHFVALCGYDQAADKILICNADRQPFSATAEWITVTQLCAAQVCAWVDVRRKTVAPPQPSPQVTQAIALLQLATTQLQQAITLLQQALAAK